MTRPEPNRRTAAEREADHAAIAELSDALLPALVARLGAGGLGELEVREGDWHVRLRRPPQPAAPARRAGRPATAHGDGRVVRDAAVAPEVIRSDGPADPGEARTVATSPAVGIFRPGLAAGALVRAGDRLAVVDMLGIGQDVIAPIDGTVAEVFVQAGEAVEYGEAIAAIEAAGTAADAGPAGPASAA